MSTLAYATATGTSSADPTMNSRRRRRMCEGYQRGRRKMRALLGDARVHRRDQEDDDDNGRDNQPYRAAGQAVLGRRGRRGCRLLGCIETRLEEDQAGRVQL